MRTRIWTAGSLAAALWFGGAWAAAKPPDLPINPKVDCKPTPRPGLELIPDAEEQAKPPARPDRFVPVGFIVTEAAELLPEPHQAEILSVMPAEVEVLPVAPRVTDDTPTCPFLREQAKPRAAAGAIDLGATALDNFRKLEDARNLLKQAKSLQGDGRFDEARRCLEAVSALCPGSRYDELAKLQAKRLTAARAVADPLEAEFGAEECLVPDCYGGYCNTALGRGKLGPSVDRMLESCKRALQQGRRGAAQAIYMRALAADYQAVMAHPLVYKTHLADELFGRPLADAGLKPGMPPVDTGIVGTLEGVRAGWQRVSYEEVELIPCLELDPTGQLELLVEPGPVWDDYLEAGRSLSGWLHSATGVEFAPPRLMLPNQPPITTGDVLGPLPKFLLDAVTGVLPLVSACEQIEPRGCEPIEPRGYEYLAPPSHFKSLHGIVTGPSLVF